MDIYHSKLSHHPQSNNRKHFDYALGQVFCNMDAVASYLLDETIPDYLVVWLMPVLTREKIVDVLKLNHNKSKW